MRLRRIFLNTGIVLGAVMTLGGLAAPFLPVADMLNHFRPLTAGGFVALCGLAVWLEERRILSLGFPLLALNGLLLCTPLLWSASVTPNAQSPRLTILAFNVWSHNARLEEAIDWVARQSADVAVLAELTTETKPKVTRHLATVYPYVYDCDCNELVVFSKRAWLAAGGQGRSEAEPSLSWLRFSDGRGGSFRFVGLRTVYPLKPLQQARHYKWMNRAFSDLREPTILAGDFNLTPWSWQLQRFSWITGLKRHATWVASWNAKGALQLPLFLIDNVLATPDIAAVSFSTGPRLGSDHLPIIATVTLSR